MGNGYMMCGINRSFPRIKMSIITAKTQGIAMNKKNEKEKTKAESNP
jgi:hypothetical protein